MTLDPKRIAECVFDITSVACSILYKEPQNNLSDHIDSRTMFQSIYDWAVEFETLNTDPDDYMLDIELFAYRKLADLEYCTGRIDIRKE